MRNNFKIIFIASLLSVLFWGNFAYADTLIHLNIKTNTSVIYDDDIYVASCDSLNDGVLTITAYCAILQSGIQNDWNWDWAPGAFLNSLGDIAGYVSKDSDNNDVYHFWSWSLNNTEAMIALNQHELQTDDLISLNFIDPIFDNIDTDVPVSVNTDGGFVYKTPLLSIPKAVDYLKDTHRIYKFGSDSDLYTDWATIAYSAVGILDETHDLIYSNLKNYDVPSSLLTNNERRTMVLLSLGENPYYFMGVNYVESILDAFDGVQFGDEFFVNDDVFALIPLASVGYTVEDEIIIQDVAFILAKQNKNNGSWEDSVDLTAATIQALFPFQSIPGVSSSISKASNYLKNMQRENGGWDSVYSTSWAMQAMNTLNIFWTRSGQSPIDYFNSQQAEDGAILLSDASVQNKMWATSYVLPAVLGKPWAVIFTRFPKPVEDVVNKINLGVINNNIKNRENKNTAVVKENNLMQANTLESNHSFVKTFLSAGSNFLDSIRNGIRQLFP